MKKMLFVLCLVASVLFLVLNVSAQSSKANNKSSLSALNGAWNSVNPGGGGLEHSLYHDGFVTNISQDSTGAWKDIYSGTYEITGDIYKQKILYCSNPEYTGGTHWQKFKIKGDTLYLTFFVKVLDASGNDVTAMFKPATGSNPVGKYVRAKR